MKSWLSAIKLILTLKCEQSTRIVSDSLDRDLTFAERWAVRMHYIACWSCRRFGKQIHMLRHTLHDHPCKTKDDVQLSPEAMKRIRDAMDAEN